MSYRPQQPYGPPPVSSGPYYDPQSPPNQLGRQQYGFVPPPDGFGAFPVTSPRQPRKGLWIGGFTGIFVATAVLVTGLMVPGWM